MGIVTSWQPLESAQRPDRDRPTVTALT